MKTKNDEEFDKFLSEFFTVKFKQRVRRILDREITKEIKSLIADASINLEIEEGKLQAEIYMENYGDNDLTLHVPFSFEEFQGKDFASVYHKREDAEKVLLPIAEELEKCAQAIRDDIEEWFGEGDE